MSTLQLDCSDDDQMVADVMEKIMPRLPHQQNGTKIGTKYVAARARVEDLLHKCKQQLDDNNAELTAFENDLETATAAKEEAEKQAGLLKKAAEQQVSIRLLRSHIIALIVQFTGRVAMPHFCEKHPEGRIDVYSDTFGFTYELDEEGLHISHMCRKGSPRTITLMDNPEAPIDEPNWDMLTGFIVNCLKIGGVDATSLPLIKPAYLDVAKSPIIPVVLFEAAAKVADEAMETDGRRVFLRRIHPREI